MIKATLRYTDCLEDGRTVLQILARHRVVILKTKTPIFTIYPKIIAVFKDYNELQDVLYQLNNNCKYEVRLVKWTNVEENQL